MSTHTSNEAGISSAAKVEIVDGLPIPFDHPSFEFRFGEWHFWSTQFASASIGFYVAEPLHQIQVLNMRNAARCFWLDAQIPLQKQFKAVIDKVLACEPVSDEERQKAIEAQSICDEYGKHAEMARVWRT